MNDLDRARHSAERMMRNDASTKAMNIGIEIPATGQAVATMTVRDDMLNGFEVCHGGHIFTLADTAFAFACNAYNRQTLSASASIQWLRSAKKGNVLTALAREEELDGRHGFYAVTVRNQDDELIALFRGHSIASEKTLFDEA